jgi:hypothetical protein
MGEIYHPWREKPDLPGFQGILSEQALPIQQPDPIIFEI